MIDLKEVLWARETEEPPQTLALVLTKTAGHNLSWLDVTLSQPT